MKFKDLVDLIEDVSSTPPAIISQVQDTKLTFDDIYNFLKQNEGVRPTMYLDTRGIPTIGIGFNLTRKDAPSILKNIGANYNLIMSRKQSLNEEQIKRLFQINLQTAYNDVKQFYPQFDGLPKQIKLALIDLSFNLGYTNLSKFIKFKEALITKNYNIAANELASSRWASQVGNRANKIINIFSSYSS